MVGDPIGIAGLEFGKLGPGSLDLQALIGARLAEACRDRTGAADRIEEKRIFPAREKNLDTPIRGDMAGGCPPQKRAIL